MAQPTFGAIITDARDYLGDEKGGVFKDPYLIRWASRALDELISVFSAYQLSSVLVISAPITLAAAVTEIDPATTAGLGNLSEPQFIEERPTGSTENYTEVARVDILPQRDATDKLAQYTNNQGKFQFVGATQSIDLRFHFFSSGDSEALDKSMAINIDDCRGFLAAATAAKAGPGKGYTDEAAHAAAVAYGPNNPNPLAMLGGYLEVLVNKQLRVQEQSPVVPALYRAGMNRRYRQL